MSVSAFHDTYTPEDNLNFINQDPEGFLEGVFSVPAEITSWDEWQLPLDEYRAKSDAFRVGYTYAGNWAMKNGRVKIQEVEDV